MLEGSTMEMGKFYISLFIIFSMVSLNLFFISANHANEFKQSINYQIERHGGLTADALDILENINQEHYSGKFNIQSSQLNEQYPFGEEISYTVNTTFDFFFLPLLSREISLRGSALSLIR